MIDETVDGIIERDKHVQIRQGAERAPNKRSLARAKFLTEQRRRNGCAEHKLRN